MYKQLENKDHDKQYPHISCQDLSPDRNILAYNPYVNNQTPIKPFLTEDIKEGEKPATGYQKRALSPQPRQQYNPTPTVIHYPRQNSLQQGQTTKRIEKVWVQNQNVSHEEKQKIVNGLKEYFDKILKGLTDQMNFQLRRRDQDIKKMQKKLKDNQTQIMNKQREINKLKDHEVEMINNNLNKMTQDRGSDKGNGKSKQVQELHKNFQYLTGRIRDIDSKVKSLIQSFASNAKQNKILGKMEQKVNGFLEQFIKIQTKKVYGLNLRMFEFFSSKDSLLVALERQVQATKETLINDNSPSRVNMTVYDQKLSTMRRQLDGLQKTIQYIGDRQTKTQFDPIKLQKLQKQIARLQEKSHQNQGYGVKWDVVEDCEKQYKAILSRINKVYGELHSKKAQGQGGYERVAGHFKTTPKKESRQQRQQRQQKQDWPDKKDRYECQQIKPLKQKKISAPQQPSTSTSSNALYFSYHDSNSDIEHFNQSDDESSNKGKMNEKLLRLIEIIRTNRKAMPLKIVVDETGYLKERETGAYLFDRNGVLFELEDDELQDAVKRRIIKI